MTKVVVSLFALCLLVSGCGSSSGSPTTYNVTLKVSAETPPCTSAGASATGGATVSIDAANTMIVVTNFTFSGLSGASTASHVHSGTATASGPVVLNFGSALTSPISKTFTASDYLAATGAPANFASFITALKAGQSYINVHTAACAGGEIRAQIM